MDRAGRGEERGQHKSYEKAVNMQQNIWKIQMTRYAKVKLVLDSEII